MCTDATTTGEDDDTFRVFKINHDIPICESVSPNSSYRWHSMDDKEYQAYLNRLESEKPSCISCISFLKQTPVASDLDHCVS